MLPLFLASSWYIFLFQGNLRSLSMSKPFFNGARILLRDFIILILDIFLVLRILSSKQTVSVVFLFLLHRKSTSLFFWFLKSNEISLRSNYMQSRILSSQWEGMLRQSIWKHEHEYISRVEERELECYTPFLAMELSPSSFWLFWYSFYGV